VAADSSKSDSTMHEMTKDHHHDGIREERVSVIVKDEYMSNAANVHHGGELCSYYVYIIEGVSITL
jgi:hypothetical protein